MKIVLTIQVNMTDSVHLQLSFVIKVHGGRGQFYLCLPIHIPILTKCKLLINMECFSIIRLILNLQGLMQFLMDILYLERLNISFRHLYIYLNINYHVKLKDN